MKKLIIVESPAKIKTISKFLGKDYKIMSTMGHIMDLPARKLGITLSKPIGIEYVPLDDKEKLIAELVKAAMQSDEVYLAPDPDREGEIIAWHTQQQIKRGSKNPIIKRISFNEITKPAVLEALQNPSQVDLKRVAAQQARRVLDRWVGYEVSPILWRKISKGLSAGRVQSVALKLICDREQAIRDFKPVEYWSIIGLFAKDKAKLPAPLVKINNKKADIKNEKQAKQIIGELEKSSFSITDITDKKRLRKPYAPFMTSTLQQDAYNRLRFNVKKTMQIAQKLYEGVEISGNPTALITYMRTDSTRIADTALKQVRSFIDKSFGGKYLPKSVQVYTGKSKGKTQDAHEAIRPIDVSITPDYARKYLTPDQAKLYDLIWRRFVACQMTPAEYAQRQVTIEGGKYTFSVTGSTLIFDGFLKAYADTQDEDTKTDKVTIPKTIKKGDAVTLKKIDPKQHFTQPPPRYTEASLVKDMEKEGIGRPSTYATILNTIRARSYTHLDEKKRFVPTELGMTVTKMLSENLPKIMNIKFTAHMEEDLDKVEQGEMERDKLLYEFWDTFKVDLDKFRGEARKPPQETSVTCPQCKKHKLVIRFGKSGEFLGCSGYPDCSFTSNFKRDDNGNIVLEEKQEPELLDEICPQCKKHKLRQMVGKFGPFIACSGFPECKYIKKEVAGFKCPLDKGEITRRTWRGGKFWGCSNYPKCKFAIFDEIEETKCPQCKLPFLIKKTAKDGSVTLLCSDKECGYKK
jgi:DNA topoisomerase I